MLTQDFTVLVDRCDVGVVDVVGFHDRSLDDFRPADYLDGPPAAGEDEDVVWAEFDDGEDFDVDGVAGDDVGVGLLGGHGDAEVAAGGADDVEFVVVDAPDGEGFAFVGADAFESGGQDHVFEFGVFELEALGIVDLDCKIQILSLLNQSSSFQHNLINIRNQHSRIRTRLRLNSMIIRKHHNLPFQLRSHLNLSVLPLMIPIRNIR